MLICPRCAQQVDETAHAACPHCFTPLPAAGFQAEVPAAGQIPHGQSSPGQPLAPPAYAPQLSRSGGARVSLTGEVIDDHAASASPPSYVGGGAPARPPIGIAPRPEGTVSRIVSRGVPVPEARAKSGGAPIVVFLIGLLVLGGLGAGGWWFLTPHSSPKAVVQKFDTAIAANDWKTLYSLIEMSADAKSQYPNADTFASSMTDQLAKARSNPLGTAVVDAFTKAYQTAQIGEPTVTGDSATVPVTITISLSLMGTTRDKTSTQQVPLRKVNGAWKIDGLQGALSGAGVPGSM